MFRVEADEPRTAADTVGADVSSTHHARFAGVAERFQRIEQPVSAASSQVSAVLKSEPARAAISDQTDRFEIEPRPLAIDPEPFDLRDRDVLAGRAADDDVGEKSEVGNKSGCCERPDVFVEEDMRVVLRVEERSNPSRSAGTREVPEVPSTAAIEIQALYADFARMAEAIARRSLYLRDFAHASHEFKTPLAGIRGAIEILEDHGDGMSDADRHRFLSNITADADRLALLVTHLLELARADMADGAEGGATDLAPALHHVAEGYRADQFAVLIEIDETLVAAISPTVLVALIDNARQAGAQKVRLDLRSDGKAITLGVTDDGPGVPIADRERIFEPFFTQPPFHWRHWSGIADCALAAVIRQWYD